MVGNQVGNSVVSVGAPVGNGVCDTFGAIVGKAVHDG